MSAQRHSYRRMSDGLLAEQQQPPQPPPTLEETDLTRHREIMSKAVSAILLLTLKWFKRSRESREICHPYLDLLRICQTP